MPRLFKAILIGGGVVGLVCVGPFCVYAWMMRGFAEGDERGGLLLFCFGLPALSLAAIAAGLFVKFDNDPPAPPPSSGVV